MDAVATTAKDGHQNPPRQLRLRPAVALRRPADTTVPHRRSLPSAEARLTDREAFTLDNSGIPWSRPRLGTSVPLNDSSRRMHPYLARGLGCNPGVFHEMSRSDGAIAGVLALRVREILRARWYIKPPLAPTDKEVELTKLGSRFCGFDGSYGWLRNGFRRWLYHAHESTKYGFSPHEYAWENRVMDGQTFMSPGKVRWIAPRSVLGWVLDEDTGDMVGLLQETQASPGSAMRQRVLIPGNRLINTVHNWTEGNPEGTSDLRPCWVWWDAKKGYLLRQVRMEEAQAAGFQVWTQLLDEDNEPLVESSQSDIDELISVSEDIANGEVFAAVVPAGWQFGMTHPGMSIPPRVEEMTYLDRQIFLALRAVLLGLDASHSGSQALSGTTGQLLQNSLVGTADEIAEPFNGIEGDMSTGLLRALYEANHDMTGQRAPLLAHSGLDHQSLKDFADSWTKLAQFFALTPTAEDEAEWRARLGSPEFTLDELRELRAKRLELSQVSQDGTQAPIQPPSDAITPAEAEATMRGMSTQLDEAVSDVQEMLEGNHE